MKTRSTSTPRKRRAVPVGVFLASLFMSSVILRVADEDARATAAEALTGLSRETSGADPAPALGGAAPSPASVAAELLRQRRELEERERTLALREKDLEIVAIEVERRLRRLEATERRLDAALNVASGIAEEDIRRMTAMYAAMKPKQAAALFSEMEPDFAAGFLRRMAPEAASKIMGEMAPETAYTISVVFAGQHQDLPVAGSSSGPTP